MKTGLIGALAEEIEQFKLELNTLSTIHEGGFELYEGILEGKSLIVAQSGIGKVNAAMVTQLLLRRGAERIIFTGVAGGVDPSLNVGDIVISDDAVQHDVDVTGLGFAPGHIPEELNFWQADTQLKNLAYGAASMIEGITVIKGRIASGDQFIADPARVQWLRDTFGAACAEMEGASVAHVCSKWDKPFVIIRSISDTADHEAGMDFKEFTPLAADRAKQVVRSMLKQL